MMEHGKPSGTAMVSGFFRAEHVRLDAPPWILEDSLAGDLLEDVEVEALEASMAKWTPEVRAAFRVHHAVRARTAEDVAIEGLAKGRDRYVILGAGLDTFAWRNPRASEFAIWELDHPDTQAWKRNALRRSGISEPENVHFVSIDLSITSPGQIEMPAKATWNWLGVTMYLEKSATESTLRSIAAKERGTVLIVNFLLALDGLDELALAVRTTVAKAAAEAGEPVLAAYTREEIRALLHDAGFTSAELLDAGALSNRYLGDRDDLQIPSSTIIAVATV